MSEQSSVYEGASYDEVFLSGHRLEEGLFWSSKRESSTQSPIDREEDFDGDEVEEIEGNVEDEGEGENEGEFEIEGGKDENESDGGASMEGSSGDGHTRPFILPKIWTVNDFKPMMMANIFKNL